jgi:hypothetical protein
MCPPGQAVVCTNNIHMRLPIVECVAMGEAIRFYQCLSFCVLAYVTYYNQHRSRRKGTPSKHTVSCLRSLLRRSWVEPRPTPLFCLFVCVRLNQYSFFGHISFIFLFMSAFSCCPFFWMGGPWTGEEHLKEPAQTTTGVMRLVVSTTTTGVANRSQDTWLANNLLLQTRCLRDAAGAGRRAASTLVWTSMYVPALWATTSAA